MLNRTRVWRLYCKDLLDIVRDRRTLIAMIVVPIVLYPLLMLGSIQAASVQAENIRDQHVLIGVQTKHVADWLDWVLRNDKLIVDQILDEDPQALAETFNEYRVVAVDHTDLETWVAEGQGHTALWLSLSDIKKLARDNWVQLDSKVVADTASIRSDVAASILTEALTRHSIAVVEQRVIRMNLPTGFGQPLVVDQLDVASAEKRGGWMLGQIMPLILILMTITGAIYPAIDLTAGERERGTLETLMVCPIPVVEIITGKFLVVATVALCGAGLNLLSMGLTIHFGGIGEALSDGATTELPTSALPMILLCLIPLAVLFSAVLLAVCSFARTFKEAQNYVTPVIISVLLPAGIAALPGSELKGATVFLPVANMVLLTRELLIGEYDLGAIIATILSTTIYAATAVAVAVRVFGQEAVLFADSGSWRAQFDRQLFQRRRVPSPTLALMYVALLFPTWFYVNGAIQSAFTDPKLSLLVIQMMMLIVFAVMPMLLLGYYKVDILNGLSFRKPQFRFMVGAALVGVSAWTMVHELTVLQYTMGWFGVTDEFLARLKPLSNQFSDVSPYMAILLGALIPGFCEEVLFRGLLQSGLRQSFGRWTTALSVGVVFACYHFIVQRFMVTFAMGVLLAWICWQSRSIWPAILIHVLHNGISLLASIDSTKSTFERSLGLPEESTVANLPLHVLIPGGIILMLGLLLCARADRDVVQEQDPFAEPSSLEATLT